MTYTPLFGSSLRIRRKVFVSYHHGGDQHYYDTFSGHFHDNTEVVSDRSLERAFDSDDSSYVMRRIREKHITGSSCTVVLCSPTTPERKYVDWEIAASLDQGNGLIGVKLPSLQIYNNGCAKPARLQDNINSGYAEWTQWDVIMNNPDELGRLIESANRKSRDLRDNTRSRRLRNGS
mgnify:CR=1 FL=1|tara:strand:+ start:326 stop:856 length:531 start_codon:yes stop_codon:yes gene_type:complete